jgi:transcriptional regulator with XRE-family HTH domain
MVENTGTFAERFEKLRNGMSYQALSEAVEAKTGVRISGQAMHKWVSQDGGITLENAQAIAAYFNVKPGWLLFGEGEEAAQQPGLEQAIGELPDDTPQRVLDFIQYNFDRAEGLLASDKLAHYTAMIDKIKRDLEARKKNDGDQ